MRMRLQFVSRQAYRDRDKPRQGVVAITLNLFQNGAVGFIDWLDGSRESADNEKKDTLEQKYNRNDQPKVDVNIVTRVLLSREIKAIEAVDPSGFKTLQSGKHTD